jgi:molybdate transport system ATP-binding protein
LIHINVKKILSGSDGQFEMALALDIKERSIVALTGVSGSGKTTLLRMIAGLTDPDSGEIFSGEKTWFDKNSGINVKPQGRRIGFVFQELSLFPKMTVRENIEYAGGNTKMVDDLLELTELKNMERRFPETLSGGQKQRVALARAISREPDILLLDEPFSSLDQSIKTKLQDEILKIHDYYPVTTIFVSHDITEIFKLSSRLVKIDKGIVVQDGSPRQLLTERETSHKFSFVGQILDIRKNDIVYTVLIAAGNTINEVVLTKEDVQNLRPGDKVMAAAKAFQPIVKKIG